MADEKTIAFVPRRSRIRPYKIAKALRYLDGVRTVLICEEKWYDPSLHDGIFDKVRFYKKAPPFGQNKYVKILDDRLNPKHSKLAELVREEVPDLIHAFCEPYDHIQYLLKHLDIPVVMSDGADFSGIAEGIEHLATKALRTNWNITGSMDTKWIARRFAGSITAMRSFS
jgi:hypothetical protein